MITKYDVSIIAAIIIIALVFYVMFAFVLWHDHPEYAVIYVDGEEYATYSLSGVKGAKTVEINTEFGRNVLEITSKSVKVVEASCSDKLDVKCGEITKPNQVIICVPNKMSVRLVGKTQEVDKVTY